jgi:putative peptidoglycan lipid II flippase
MGLFFYYLINMFENKLVYEENFKAIYLIGSVLLTLIFYLLVAFFIKAFKINDIKLKY